jgi:membrane protein required for colicin V production
MSFNWLDVVLALVLLVSALGALRNGLSKEIIRLCALVAGIVGGLWWYHEAGSYLQPIVADERIANFGGFFAILFGALIAGVIVAWVLAKILGWVGLRWFDRLLGGAFGLVRGGLICAAMVLALLAFTPLTRSTEIVAESAIAPWVLQTANAATLIAPRELRESYDASFTRVKAAWIGELSKPAVSQAGDPAMSVAKESPIHTTAQ